MPADPPSSPRASTSHPSTPLTTPNPPTAKEWRVAVGLTNDVQFVPAKNASVLGGGIEGKYKPINDSDMEMSSDPPEEEQHDSPPRLMNGKGKAKASEPPQTPASPPFVTPKRSANTTLDGSSSAGAGPSTPSRRMSVSAVKELHTEPMPTHWPEKIGLGRGLSNVGNTCFLNSVLQCLFYTPPLLHMLYAHSHCPIPSGMFCMVCSLRDVTRQNFNGQRGYFNPGAINGKLQQFAKGMQRGRQEDAHEFLRQLIDSLQKTCLLRLPPKERLNHAVAETSWVHKIFGGKTRSRVTCRTCGHNSDTFEACLDLSLDLRGMPSVERALAAFVGLEQLGGEGKDRYKCEKCKIPVDAQKQFTIHSAPLVLTIHLKRFTPMGRKIGRQIDYAEHLDLAPYVSDGEFGPRYFLYGLICHSGSGPHSGHYFAHIKGPGGRWHEMNDEERGFGRNVPLGLKSAYILFYMQEGQSRLHQAIGWKASNTHTKKRRIESDDEEEEEGPSRSESDVVMGGPEIAAAAAREQEKISSNGKALSLKIQAAAEKKSAKVNVTPWAPTPMVDYSDHDEDLGEKVADEEDQEETKVLIGPQLPPHWSKPQAQPVAAAPSESTLLASSVATINLLEPIKSSSSFYSSTHTSSSLRKRSSPTSPASDTDSDRPVGAEGKRKKQKKRDSNFDPRRSFGSLGSSTLHNKRGDGEGEKKGGSSVRNGMRPKLKRSLM